MLLHAVLTCAMFCFRQLSANHVTRTKRLTAECSCRIFKLFCKRLVQNSPIYPIYIKLSYIFLMQNIYIKIFNFYIKFVYKELHRVIYLCIYLFAFGVKPQTIEYLNLTLKGTLVKLKTCPSGAFL